MSHKDYRFYKEGILNKILTKLLTFTKSLPGANSKLPISDKISSWKNINFIY